MLGAHVGRWYMMEPGTNHIIAIYLDHLGSTVRGISSELPVQGNSFICCRYLSTLGCLKFLEQQPTSGLGFTGPWGGRV